jgi:hypothetical protein
MNGVLSLTRPFRQVTCWPESPHLTVVVAVTSQPEGGGADHDQATVACARDQLREPADWQEDRMKPFSTVDRARLFRVCSQISATDFEE